MSIARRFLQAANKNPEKTAVVVEDREYSYSDLASDAGKIASSLRDFGIKKGDRVALMLPNSYEFVISYFGTMATGATLVPINVLLKPAEVTYILKDSGARYFIVLNAFYEKMKDSLAELNLDKVIVLGPSEDGVDFVSMLKNDADYTPNEDIEKSDVAVCLYTSGTTGKPKGALLTQQNLIVNALASAEAIDFGPEDRMVTVLPMFHAFAGTVCLLMPLIIGGSIVAVPRFMPQTILEIISRTRATYFAGVPTMYTAMLMVPDKSRFDLSCLRFGVSGGAALPVQVLHKFEKAFGVKIIEGYGPTEASPVVSVNPALGKRKVGSVGLPLGNIEVKIFDENDEELPAGKVGELVVKGPSVMKGYLNRPEATRKTLRNGWLHTGDLARMDKEGYIYIVDRKKDMIIVGGMNVYPREVEEVLYKHEAIAEAAVIGVEDDLRGEVPKAVVVLREGAELSERDLIKYCNEHLASYKVPRRVEFRDSLPKSATGKILKRVLRDEEKAEGASA